MNDSRTIEAYLMDTLDAQERLLFEAYLLTDPFLKIRVRIQRQVYTIVRLYHRKKLKEDTERIHQRLFKDPLKRSFQHSITDLFKQ